MKTSLHAHLTPKNPRAQSQFVHSAFGVPDDFAVSQEHERLHTEHPLLVSEGGDVGELQNVALGHVQKSSQTYAVCAELRELLITPPFAHFFADPQSGLSGDGVGVGVGSTSGVHD